ncbi:MAG: transposase [Caballeronia sp.]|nr:transposase [Caballeronia sp.]
MTLKAERAQYTLEFKLEAVRLVKNGQSLAAVSATLGVVQQTLHNSVKADREGKLGRGAPSLAGPLFVSQRLAEPCFSRTPAHDRRPACGVRPSRNSPARSSDSWRFYPTVLALQAMQGVQLLPPSGWFQKWATCPALITRAS